MYEVKESSQRPFRVGPRPLGLSVWQVLKVLEKAVA